jgi:hypothetical protein
VAEDSELAGAELVILELLAERGSGKTICPSEAARRLAEMAGCPDRWREWMKRTRTTANSMAARGRLVILQRGERVDGSTARGAVPLGLP